MAPLRVGARGPGALDRDRALRDTAYNPHIHFGEHL
jgi:hypothetical protein